MFLLSWLIDAGARKHEPSDNKRNKKLRSTPFSVKRALRFKNTE